MEKWHRKKSKHLNVNIVLQYGNIVQILLLDPVQFSLQWGRDGLKV